MASDHEDSKCDLALTVVAARSGGPPGSELPISFWQSAPRDCRQGKQSGREGFTLNWCVSKGKQQLVYEGHWRPLDLMCVGNMSLLT